MPDEKGLGSKILGIFIESEGKNEDAPVEAGKSPADIVAELANQAGPGGRAAAGAPPPPSNLKLTPAGVSDPKATDFDAVFRGAGMDGSELDRVKKAEELLKGLPEATPTALKKQIVETSLKAFGFEIDKIVSAAQNQKRALDAYVKVNEQATAKAIQDAELQIRQLNEKIAGLKADIEKRNAALNGLSSAAQTRKGEVQKVLDFFAPGNPTAAST